ncbi:hypothetical protein C0J52_18793 [Blattella germanica]|nr:hypothetical protein C0J52_18793 [Blattella germanica]
MEALRKVVLADASRVAHFLNGRKSIAVLEGKFSLEYSFRKGSRTIESDLKGVAPQEWSHSSWLGGQGPERFSSLYEILQRKICSKVSERNREHELCKANAPPLNYSLTNSHNNSDVTEEIIVKFLDPLASKLEIDMARTRTV